MYKLVIGFAIGFAATPDPKVFLFGFWNATAGL